MCVYIQPSDAPSWVSIQEAMLRLERPGAWGETARKLRGLRVFLLFHHDRILL